MGKGQYQTDNDSGLILLGHRYYDASVGRFISSDPAKAGNNWYAYCENNALKKVDPHGLDGDGWTFSFGFGGAAIGGVWAAWFDLEFNMDSSGDAGVGGHVGTGPGAGYGYTLGPSVGLAPGTVSTGEDDGTAFGGLLGWGIGGSGGGTFGPGGGFSGASGGVKIGPTHGGGIYTGPQKGYTYKFPRPKHPVLPPKKKPIDPNDPFQGHAPGTVHNTASGGTMID